MQILKQGLFQHGLNLGHDVLDLRAEKADFLRGLRLLRRLVHNVSSNDDGFLGQLVIEAQYFGLVGLFGLLQAPNLLLKGDILAN